MKNKNTNCEINSMFISSILIYCGYKMDKNINYETNLDNYIVSKYLKKKVEKKIIKYINTNYDFTYKVIYLRNKADAECMICYNNIDCYLLLY